MDPITRAGAGVLLGVLLGPELPGPGWAWWALGVGGAAIAAPLRRLSGWPVLWVAVAVGLGCARAVPEGPRLEGLVAAEGIRVGAASGRTADLALSRWKPPGGPWIPAEGRIRVRFPEDPPPPGTPMAVSGRAGSIRRALPGAPDPVRAAALAGVRSELSARRAARLDGQPRPILAPERDPTGLIRAVVLGDRSGCSQETLQILRQTGTSHLLSISGFHVGVAAGLAMGGAGLLSRAAAAIRPQGISSPLPLGLGIGAAWAYAALAGWAIPAERAAAMLTLGVAARAAGRGIEPLPILAWIAAAVALVEPGSPASASYQLTFGAMAGLVLFVPALTRYLPPDLPSVPRWIAEGLAATVGSTLGTLPFAAWWFQAVAPLSPLANLAALPVLGVALVPIGALACAAPDPIAWLAALIGTALCRWELAILGLLAVSPWTPAVGPLGAIGLGLAVLGALRRPIRSALLGALVLGLPRRAPDDLRITFLDVGQGDSALVEWPDGRRWLVDGGPPSAAALSWLRRIGIRRLDRVIATHGDLDHTGGLIPVVESLEIGAVWALSPPEALEEAALRRGIPIVAPEGALHPWPTDPGEGNDRSIVLQVGPALLTGDIERRAEARVAERLPEAVPVLKVPHHGSRSSTSERLLSAAGPRVAIVSAGEGNPFGHPAPEVLERLRARGVTVLRTDRDGTVTLERRGRELVLTTASGRRLILEAPPPERGSR